MLTKPSRIRLARVFLGASLAAIVLTFSPRSSAQSGDVNTLIESGLERYKRQDYEGARTVFARAHEVDPSAAGILFNLALAELHSKHPVDAANHLRAFIASAQAQPERRESARTKWLPEAEGQVGKISIDAPPGTPVSVDGAQVGVAPFGEPVYVTPGGHDVAAKLGSLERSQHVSVDAGLAVTAQFLGEPAAAPAPPALPPHVPPSADMVALLDTEPEPPARSSPPTAKIATVIALGGTAVVATGMAIGFGIASLNAKNQAADLRAQMGNNPSSCYPPGSPTLPAQWPQLQAAVDAQSRNFGLQIGFYIGAGALAVTGAATWLLWPNAPARSSWTLRPSYDGRAATAVFAGSF